MAYNDRKVKMEMAAKPDITAKPELVQDELLQNEEVTLVASPSIKGIITIPISQHGKYVVTCEFSSAHVPDMEKVKTLAQRLDWWWNSDSKFFVIVQGDNIPTIRFERLEDEDEL